MSAISRKQWPSVQRKYLAGNSMRQIAVDMNVSIGAVTYVLRKTQTPRRSAGETNAIQYQAAPTSFTIRTPKNERTRTLQVMGTMLYWAEGYKSAKASGVDFVNSDPHMASLFMHFLRSRYKLDERRLRVLLYCYSNQNVDELKSFWSALLSIPTTQFSKPYVRHDHKESARVIAHGTIHIRYNDKKMLNDLRNLIDSYRSIYRVGGGVVNRTWL